MNTRELNALPHYALDSRHGEMFQIAKGAFVYAKDVQALLDRERPEIRPSESARELATKIVKQVIEAVLHITAVIDSIAALIEADRKRVLEEAAERLDRLADDHLENNGNFASADYAIGLRSAAKYLRAVILGGAKP